MAKHAQLATALGVALSALFVWLAFRNLAFGAVLDALRAAEPWPWVPLAMGSYLLGHAARGVRLRRLIRRDADLPLATATNVVVLGYAVNNILPARMGELARAGLLRDRTGMPFVQSLTVTLLERLLDGWTMVLLFFVGALLAQQADAFMLRAAWLAAAIFGAASLGIALLVRFPRSVTALVTRLASRVRPTWQEPAWRLCTHVGNGLATLRRPSEAFTLALFSIAVWALEAGLFLLLLPAFGLPMDLSWALLAMAVTNLGILVPSTPGYVGPFHYFCMQTLVMLGVAGVTATSYAIAVHAVFYVPITLWGLGVMLRYGIELGRTSAIARSARQAPAETTTLDGVEVVVLGTSPAVISDDRPSPLVRSISEALLPGAGPDGEAAPAPEVTERVATFVQGQITALPALLAIAMAVGLFGFRILVMLRYAKDFRALPLATRRRVVAFWAYGPWALTRAMFRVPRSTALLAYYEQAPEPPALLEPTLGSPA